jgi:hypothetical protein
VDVVGAVTAGAAGLAAVLAGVNLYISGRRELDRWTREALVDAFVMFLDASFKQSGACRTLTSRSSPPPEERNRLRVAVVEAHDLESDILTRLRLLAPSRVVKAAELLHQAEHRLVAVSFTEPLPPQVAIDEAAVPVRHARTVFLQSARSILKLSDTAAIEHHHRGIGWHEFRALAQAGDKGHSADTDLDR